MENRKKNPFIYKIMDPQAISSDRKKHIKVPFSLCIFGNDKNPNLKIYLKKNIINTCRVMLDGWPTCPECPGRIEDVEVVGSLAERKQRNRLWVEMSEIGKIIESLKS